MQIILPRHDLIVLDRNRNAGFGFCLNGMAIPIELKGFEHIKYIKGNKGMTNHQPSQ